jgi:hypothetical protein
MTGSEMIVTCAVALTPADVAVTTTGAVLPVMAVRVIELPPPEIDTAVALELDQMTVGGVVQFVVVTVAVSVPAAPPRTRESCPGAMLTALMLHDGSITELVLPQHPARMRERPRAKPRGREGRRVIRDAPAARCRDAVVRFVGETPAVARKRDIQ